MTADRFDRLLAAMMRARSRREMLGALAGATASGALTREATRARGVHAGACLSRNERCKRKSECCSGRCRHRKGKPKRKCVCSPRGAHCNATSDCCARGAVLLCVSGFCVPDRG
jgi:hypothetical protein